MKSMKFKSFSSFADVVKCDIYKIQKDWNSTQVNTVVLGDVNPGQYVTEEGREIINMEGMFISAQLSSDSSTRAGASEIF